MPITHETPRFQAYRDPIPAAEYEGEEYVGL